ncbi:hypothetical protein EVAR_56115_1 [Eumeta japonica]|uniref:Reverse transcriptase domain-containing protein n=1 Tax=Eumeta variegata TaxID=151549 RepID=A0A4C1YHQ1_EUMVA|nr:hypothetical protein EVAR_56115_1 [Eumeta japonica]
MKALKRIKVGNTAGYERVPSEMLKPGGGGCLVYANDEVIPVPSVCKLQEMITKMNDSIYKRGMNVNVSKTTVMMFETSEIMTECDRSMCGVPRKDSCRNSDVRMRYGLKEDVVTRVERERNETRTTQGSGSEGPSRAMREPRCDSY